MTPSFLSLDANSFSRKVEHARELLADCRLCPRDCGVNRLEDEYAFCLSGRHALVSSHFPHFGEEDCLRGWNGSGTIFFGHCNLRCVFCQNFDISQRAPRKARGHTAEQIASMMLNLQDRGCHNINFVTPEHVVPQVVEALHVAADRGLEIPIVYNTSAYDSAESLALLDGLVDIYMPDFKCWNPEYAERYLKARDYPEVAREAVLEMQRQVGDLVVDGEGIAQRGLIVRHLVMPDAVDQTRKIAEFLVNEVSPNVYFNLMGQYYPAGKVVEDRTRHAYEELARRTTPAEMNRAEAAVRDVGVVRLDERKPHPRLRRIL